MQIAYQRGMITTSERDRTYAVMQRLGLALWHETCNNMPMLLRVSCASAASTSTCYVLAWLGSGVSTCSAVNAVLLLQGCAVQTHELLRCYACYTWEK